MDPRPPVIMRDATRGPFTPNLLDWQSARASFSWDTLRRELCGDRTASCNIAELAVDRHAHCMRADRIALRCLSGSDSRDISFTELAQRSNRFANVLAALSVAPGARVFVLTGKCIELYESVLGALKAQCLVSVLFSAFGPEPLKTRMRLGGAQVLVTSSELYRRKVAMVLPELPSLRHVLLIDAEPPASEPAQLLSYRALMARAAPRFATPHTDATTPALLHFTSGTTGTPKGALHAHQAALMHFMTGRFALDLHDDDVFWCTADPGWVTGMSYGILAPLLLGVTSIVDGGEFDAGRWYRLLEAQKVTVWYTAPTAIRLLMKAGPELARQRNLQSLRLIASVGEPLNAEAVWWGVDTLGLPIHDNWWQTETGGIMIGNTPSQPIKPGSMGRPLPGVDAAIVRRDAAGALQVLDTPEAQGELALRKGWPSMFRGYLDQPDRYARCFSGDWYLSGDLVRRDSDGYYWFLGRSDDVIKTSGHLVGPFEIESVLMEQPQVVEAAVVGLPDPVAGESIKAFVVLQAGVMPSEAIRERLIAHARRRLGPALAPRSLAMVPSLPHTRSGKIMRRLLRSRELGLPEGDTSALETQA